MRRFVWRTAKSALVRLRIFPRLFSSARALRFPHYRSSLVASLAFLLATAPLVDAELELKGSDLQQAVDASLADWKKGWAVGEGFALEMDTKGYHYPTAIAFVPNPGPDPKDPLYFVTEVKGKIKVVTNDRTIHTFAESVLQNDEYVKTPLAGDQQFGLAGICLEPTRGYVFVTFAYPHADGMLRNNVMRFDTKPGTFALKPTRQRAFTDVFAAFPTGPSHQIGTCAVSDGMLHVGIGDGFVSHVGSQQLNVLRGKVIRMTLDGKPVADNPFYENDDIHRPANYVWAYGLRNPFSLNVIGGQIMVTENGVHADRFLHVERGENYLWNGTDSSIGANADHVFLESVGPVQMDYFKRTSPAFPAEYKNQFYVALSSKVSQAAGIMRIPYSMAQGRMAGLPEYVIRATDDVLRPVTGAAFGPDGLYFVPILPAVDGVGAVLKIKYDPRHAHPITLQSLSAAAVATADEESIYNLMRRRGCIGCHRVGDQLGGSVGPTLGDEAMIERIQQRVDSPEFLKNLEALNARDEAPFNQYQEARAEIAKAQGRERVRLYLKYQILEPRFDSPMSAMPNLDIPEVEATAIANYLMGTPDLSFTEKVAKRLFKSEEQRLAAAFGVGAVVIGPPIWLLLWWLMRRRRA